MLPYIRGMAYLLLSKIRYHVSDYTPKPIVSYDDRINYDFHVLDFWMKHAQKIAPGLSLKNKTVLEIGPGSDLGIATILAARGVAKYYAYDVHNLIDKVQPDFYEQLLDRLAKEKDLGTQSRDALFHAARDYSKTGDGSINFICKDRIDFLEIPDGELDIVFSQAAFEHIGNLGEMFSLLGPKCKPGALMIAEVDLKAHSRWVRDHDPLCIYMYPQWLYKLLSHPATPNRVRPSRYKALLRDTGWTDIRIVPLRQADEAYLEKVRPRLQPQFVDQHLRSLSMMILARKNAAES